MLWEVGHGQRNLKTLSGSLRRFWVNEFMYKSIVAGGFVWFSTTVLWFKRKPIQMYSQGSSFVSLPVKRKPTRLL